MGRDWGAVAIGIGDTVGGEIFTFLGLAVQIAKGGAPVAFWWPVWWRC